MKVHPCHGVPFDLRDMAILSYKEISKYKQIWVPAYLMHLFFVYMPFLLPYPPTAPTHTPFTPVVPHRLPSYDLCLSVGSFYHAAEKYSCSYYNFNTIFDKSLLDLIVSLIQCKHL